VNLTYLHFIYDFIFSISTTLRFVKYGVCRGWRTTEELSEAVFLITNTKTKRNLSQHGLCQVQSLLNFLRVFNAFIFIIIGNIRYNPVESKCIFHTLDCDIGRFTPKINYRLVLRLLLSDLRPRSIKRIPKAGGSKQYGLDPFRKWMITGYVLPRNGKGLRKEL